MAPADAQGETDPETTADGSRFGMVGRSAPMRRIYQLIEMAAPTKCRVFIWGESGTGKELIARAIHAFSPRRERPFVELNCAAIPSELIESEMFGHVKGSFTGAHADRRGMFETAHGGYAVPGRDRRHEPDDAGQAAARAAGTRHHARRELRSPVRSTCGW